MEIGHDWVGLSENNNTGLTEFLLKNKNSLVGEHLVNNDNPGLTDLIIELIEKGKYSPYYVQLTRNKNSGLKNYVALCPSNPNVAIVNKIRNEKILAVLTMV